MRPIIEANKLSKSFQIRANSPRYLSLRESLSQFNFLRRDKKETFWALQDVSFEVSPGESIAIIGKNGAGKSTLLKILSRITPPTKGKATIRGRMASLLEVGTGFHPELTGRENIFLNGSVMGLKRLEIKRQFDAIVDFSGVEKFLDTPLKFYSSGMQLRLAFSVAAFLEPEILLLDEVLAVGDAEFQKKGLQKMGEVAKSGKTVLFISHNMAAVRLLCERGILLENGHVAFDGPAKTAIEFYSEGQLNRNGAVWVNQIDRSPKFFLERVELRNQQHEIASCFKNSEAVYVHFFTHSNVEIANLSIGFDLMSEGVTLLRSRQTDFMEKSKVQEGEANCFVCEIPCWLLNAGQYSIRPNAAIYFTEYLSKAHDSAELSFEVEMDASRSIFHRNLDESNQPGLIFPTLRWHLT